MKRYKDNKSQNSPYDMEFVKKIKAGEESKAVRVNIDEMWK